MSESQASKARPKNFRSKSVARAKKNFCRCLTFGQVRAEALNVGRGLGPGAEPQRVWAEPRGCGATPHLDLII